MKRTKIILSFLIVFLIVFLVAHWITIRNNSRIVLNIRSNEMEFSIGQTQEKIMELFVNHNLKIEIVEDSRYKNTDRLNYYTADGKYIFVFYEGKLTRIEIRDSDGVGVVLPRNYDD